MFAHRADERVGGAVVFHWFLLAFNGGCINAGGFLAAGRFVSHVTGFATLFGVSLSEGHAADALGLLSVPVFFLAGSFLAGVLIDRRLIRGLRAHVDWVMGLSALCLFGACGVGFFERFGGDFALGHTYLLLVLLSAASGLQNGAITSSSGSTVRTTHMTGLTTDLGLGLARQLTSDLPAAERSRERRVNTLRFGSIVFFMLGSAVGAVLFVRAGYAGFLVPALIATYAAWHGRRAKVAAHAWV